jgi:hypothetical protein
MIFTEAEAAPEAAERAAAFERISKDNDAANGIQSVGLINDLIRNSTESKGHAGFPPENRRVRNAT